MPSDTLVVASDDLTASLIPAEDSFKLSAIEGVQSTDPLINVTSVSSSPGRLNIHGKVFRRDDSEAPCFLKSVAFGPFPPGSLLSEEIEGEIERIASDFGANAIRFYDPPPLSWLELCADFGLSAFITMDWNHQTDFLSHSIVRRETEMRVRDLVRRYKEYPAVAGYFISNDIPPSLIRYIGRDRVLRFLERLIDIGRQLDPEALFSYPNHSPRGGLTPANQDFFSTNLEPGEFEQLNETLNERRNDLSEIPVFISRFRVDSNAAGETGQATALVDHIDHACETGIAGTTLFTWSDLTTYENSEGESYGLIDRNRRRKEAFQAICHRWQGFRRPFQGIEVSKSTPRFSVVVVFTPTRSGSIGSVVESLEQIDYPDFEIIILNNGNDDTVREFVQPLSHVRHIGIPDGGLAKARNIGGRTATGEIIVYTTSDCTFEPDWLNWLADSFTASEPPDCVAGPGIALPAKTLEEACITAALPATRPLPSGVFTASGLNPGSNFAVRKPAFDAMDGFDENLKGIDGEFDFAWRLADSGYEIRFQPNAFLLYSPFRSYLEYFRYQHDFALSQATLKKRYPARFAYSGDRSKEERRSPFLHSGFLFLLGILFVGSFLSAWLLIPFLYGIWLTLSTSLRLGFNARIPNDFDSLWSRLSVSQLILAGEVLRSATRGLLAISRIRPLGFGIWTLRRFFRKHRFSLSNSLVLVYQGQNLSGHDPLLDHLRRNEGPDEEAAFRPEDVDLELSPSLFFHPTVVSATEPGEKGVHFTRVKVRFGLRTMIFVAALALVLFVGKLFIGHWWLPVGFLSLIWLDWFVGAIRQCNRVNSAAKQVGLELYR